jgi:hypothetical protein
MKRNTPKNLATKKATTGSSPENDTPSIPSAKRGTKPGDMRKTYIVNAELVDKIDEIAHQERTSTKAVVNEAFTNHVEKWEAENGPVPVPKKKK